MDILNIVDEDDIIIGQCEKKKAHAEQLLHRSVHIFVIKSNGQIVVQHRSRYKNTFPLHLTMSSAGHVDTGETYEQAAYRELKEELGIETSLTFVAKYRRDERPVENEWISFYVCYHDGPFVTDKTETESLMDFSLDDLNKIAESYPQLFDGGLITDLHHYNTFLSEGV